MAFPLHRGRIQLHFVATTNDTYAEGSLGHSRIEWFPTLLSVRRHVDRVIMPTACPRGPQHAHIMPTASMVAALRAYSMPGKRPGCGGRSIPLGLTPTEPCTRQRESPDAQVVLDGADPDAMRVCGDTAGKDP